MFTIRTDQGMAVMTTLCVALGMVSGILIGGCLAPPVTWEPWLKSYQGLVASLFGIGSAAAALWFALGQLRVNLMSREEDRIERVLPGMLDALALLEELDDRWRGKRAGLIAFQLIQDDDFAKDEDRDAYLAKRLARADGLTRETVVASVKYFIDVVFSLPDGAMPKSDLERLALDLRAKIMKHEQRLPKCRAEIERFFGD